MSHNNETITISDDTDSEESDSEDDDTERGVGRLAPVLFRNLSRDEDETYRDNDFMRPDDMNVEDPYEESDIPQRRSAVLAPVHVEVVFVLLIMFSNNGQRRIVAIAPVLLSGAIETRWPVF